MYQGIEACRGSARVWNMHVPSGSYDQAHLSHWFSCGLAPKHNILGAMHVNRAQDNCFNDQTFSAVCSKPCQAWHVDKQQCSM